ncbi:Cys-every-fifth RiPP peptide CefA, partial [Arthrobacter sp. PL16]|uniref:Cys-every-fifth RiPP peptide CefA n=1 Tax=Arthrobacter sp. PL16 TaxID=3071720 RepID=UPI003FA39BCF
CGVHGCGVHGCGVHGCGVHGCGVHGCGVHGCRVHGCRVRWCRVHGCRVRWCRVDGCRIRWCSSRRGLGARRRRNDDNLAIAWSALVDVVLHLVDVVLHFALTVIRSIGSITEEEQLDVVKRVGAVLAGGVPDGGDRSR